MLHCIVLSCTAKLDGTASLAATVAHCIVVLHDIETLNVGWAVFSIMFYTDINAFIVKLDYLSLVIIQVCSVASFCGCLTDSNVI